MYVLFNWVAIYVWDIVSHLPAQRQAESVCTTVHTWRGSVHTKLWRRIGIYWLGVALEWWKVEFQPAGGLMAILKKLPLIVMPVYFIVKSRFFCGMVCCSTLPCTTPNRVKKPWGTTAMHSQCHHHAMYSATTIYSATAVHCPANGVMVPQTKKKYWSLKYIWHGQTGYMLRVLYIYRTTPCLKLYL